MCSDVSKADERIQLYFNFDLHGWSELIFVHRGQISGFRVSGVFTDAPAALLDICDAVLTNSATRVALCDEPGGIVVEVTPDAKQPHTVILSVYEIAPQLAGFDANETGRLVMTTRLKRRRLVGMLLTELWKSHEFLSEPSYQRGRVYFPHARLSKTNESWNQSGLGPSFLT
ncbi:hypothetical protein [Rhizobium sp. RM]|uniref:hypothetical protein n=1 Tax=Rhizobium sp. RM TaxID=2748079 RepID=UPI00110E3FA3|nr:hypothetical protein [Rhizobium sp. RM]NWJ25259.1 hypothetical protein [Rhizobium sp. RM]TMV19887.1 hypothetical protein BJG94_11760 [Rhizobium sp. Td3]